MFKKSAVELLLKDGYSILLNFPQGDYKEFINELIDYVKEWNKQVKVHIGNVKLNEKHELT